ncbi:hypothetical protein GOP47_0010982 [Adiantum capillus-veneris]|uniref:Uncharacterized protein n=2 Tax=Adiantum capillus-veneris TaxID=13818 RepID=A0A9D4UW36_ADICA|nr:hypothetical protein GOP47_0010982 [Adiantum capillus-veneris]
MGAETEGVMRARKRGCTSNIIHRFLRWLNYTVILASIITIICMLALRLVPTAWGWGFLSFSFLSITSAIVGLIATSSRGTCHSVNMFLLITSTCVQCSVFLLLITRPSAVLDKFKSNRSDYDGRILLKVDAALLLWIFCVQVVVLAMSCIMHYCEPVDYYEDLEGNPRATRRGSRRLSRVQEESIADAQAEAAKTAASEASRLHKEMKEKYSQKKEEAYDNVEI